MKASRSSTKISKAFFRGNYREVLELGFAPGAGKVSDADIPLLIGALGFQGRRDEAQALFGRREKSLSESARIASRFFLGVSFCRHGEYAKAREHFARNISEGKRSKDRVTRFYLLQGVGFYRYFCARFESARKAAQEALAAATWAGSGYGIALAGDLFGHCLIQIGRIREGLGQLEEAERAAARIGDGGLARSIKISQLVYSAQFGLRPARDLRDLETALTKLDPQNSHAQANLLLEIANQLLLRGRLAEASQALSEASTRIYRSRHLRYGNQLSLRLAELSYRAGQSASALHTVKSVRAALDERHDRVLLLTALGLELKLIRELGISDAEDEVRLRLERLTRATPRAISKAMLARGGPGESVSLETREDLLGSFLDAFRKDPRGQLRKLLSAGYLELLPEALGVPRSGCRLVFGLLGQDCAILERGEALYRRKGVTQQMTLLLTALGQGECSKAELVRAIWGYQYHPLRHDPLIFQAISRVREMLGNRSHWVESTAAGYRLWPEVRVVSLRSEEREPEPAWNRQVTPARAGLNSGDLNFRQVRILELMKKKRFLAASECAKTFRVTEMTARRDFTALMKAGWIARTGRARATRYELSRVFE